MARRDPLLDRALIESATKYGPQGSALQSLLQELAGQYTRGRRVQASNAAGITAATQHARPDVSQAFDQALASGGAQRAALGVSGADPQAQAFQRRVGEQRANALVDLTQRALRAEEGKVFANNAAREGYLADKSKVQGQLRELAAQQGADTASTYGKLKDDRLQRGLTRRGQDSSANSAAAGRAQSERNSQRAAGIDPDTGRPIPGGRLDGKVKTFKPASQAAHTAARGAIEEAIAQIHDLRLDDTGRPDPHASRADIIGLLIKGVPAEHVPESVDKDGKKVPAHTVPAIPRLPADLVRAASNIVFDRTLSRGDVQRLHNLGLRVRSLGYPTRSGKAKTKPRSAVDLVRSPGRAAGLSSRPPVPASR